MSKSVLVSFFGLMTLLCACSSVKVEDHQANQPILDPRAFFEGELKAYGTVHSRSGELLRYFSADISASWQGNIGTLDETFYFDDGKEEKRIWTLTQAEDGAIMATANDVVGDHPMFFSGNALFMEYVLRIPYKDKTIDVVVDDRMYLVEKNRIINQSIMRKFGFRVAAVNLVIEKL